MGMAKTAVHCSEEAFLINQTLVLRINICAKTTPLHQAEKCHETKKQISDKALFKVSKSAAEKSFILHPDFRRNNQGSRISKRGALRQNTNMHQRFPEAVSGQSAFPGQTGQSE